MDDSGPFAVPVEVDETFVGGKRRNIHYRKLKGLKGRGWAEKTPVIGAKDRATGRVKARVIERTDRSSLHGFVRSVAREGATIYTDEANGYDGLRNREAVAHGRGEYVRDGVGTNGIEAFWVLLKRGYVGTYHSMSPKHLHRYVREFVVRHNQRNDGVGTIGQMESMVEGMAGKHQPYKILIW